MGCRLVSSFLGFVVLFSCCCLSFFLATFGLFVLSSFFRQAMRFKALAMPCFAIVPRLSVILGLAGPSFLCLFLFAPPGGCSLCFAFVSALTCMAFFIFLLPLTTSRVLLCFLFCPVLSTFYMFVLFFWRLLFFSGGGGGGGGSANGSTATRRCIKSEQHLQ